MESDDKTRIVSLTQTGTENSDKTVFVGNKTTQHNEQTNPPVALAGTQLSNPDVTQFSPSKKPLPQPAINVPAAGSTTSVTKTVIKGRFELDALLGVGGMGAVYKALDRRKIEAGDSEPYVAIKLLNDDFKKHPDAFISLQREARKSQNLAHPNIVNVFDFDRDNEMVFMTMEFLEGSPLDTLIRENPTGLEFEAATSILKDISQALLHAHSHNIVHSDFKPGNIFVTSKKGSKVFDFGIARAVTEGGISGSVGEQTLFDAGTLGALTPAYASYEMLKGEEPAPADDVYALACVAYELFVGKHPFNKTPADQAFEKKLKPKRLKQLSRRQWRALEAALEFKRENRTATISEFIHQFFGKSRWLWISSGALLLSISTAASVYSVFYSDNEAQIEEVTLELQEEHHAERVADRQDAIDRVVSLAILNDEWENNIRSELDSYKLLEPDDTKYVTEIEQQVSALFIHGAQLQLEEGNLDSAEELLQKASLWFSDSDQAQVVQGSVNQKREEIRLKLEAERIEAEKRAEALRRQQELERIRQAKLEHERKVNSAINNLEKTLICNYDINITEGVGGAIQQLADLESTKANAIRPIVAKELNGCLTKLATKNPLKTEPLLRQAKSLFADQTKVLTLKLDYCGHLKPGSGGKNARNTCRDRLLNNQWGPHMVVVNSESRKKLVIGKYEITYGDLKPFCDATEKCQNIKLGKLGFPATNIPVTVAQNYLEWLSNQTGNNYRLPNEREWFAAASANGEREAADRNCHLKYGGIEKGLEMFATKAGTQNKFGLVNHVGNAQEWVIGADKQLLAAGGHHKDPMSRCLATTKRRHDGKADEITTFRVARDLN